jgi:DDE superfamily endonuclease/putative transposase ISC1217
MLLIPSFARPVLDQFAPVFFQPTYQRLLILLVAAILTPGRRTVSNLRRTGQGLAPGHPSSYHRVFSKRRWSTFQLARLLVPLILDSSIPDGPLFLAGDDTGDEHRGAQVHGQGGPRDPVRSTHAFTAYRWGHKWVVLTILVPVPFTTRPWALPVLVALYRRADKTKGQTKTKRKKATAKDQTKAKAQQRARRKTQARDATPRHKTPSELRRQLLAVLIPGFPDRQFVFAGDGGSGTHALARLAHRHQRPLSLVSLFYPDANLYDPPPPVVGKRRGRTRTKGEKRPAPEAVVAATTERTALNVSWYGGGRRDVAVVSGTGQGYKGGVGLVPVLGVFVQDRTGTHRDSYLFTTNLSLTAQQLIEIYTGRWSIETTFQELRAYLGLETTRGWKERTVLRATPCLFGLFSVVCLLSSRLPAGPATAGAVSYRGKTEVTFSDAITAVRRQLWLEGIFESHGQTEVFENLPRPFQALLLAAWAHAA